MLIPEYGVDRPGIAGAMREEQAVASRAEWRREGHVVGLLAAGHSGAKFQKIEIYSSRIL